MVLGPAWTRGEIEKPAGERNHGSWTSLVYTEEQQARLGVDERGEKVAAAPSSPAPAAREEVPEPEENELEPPEGLKDMGMFFVKIYTAAQQARLGVDELGYREGQFGEMAGTIIPKEPKQPAEGSRPKCGLIGPAWTRGEIEKPAGEKDMGGWVAGVYTAEQQARLGVDEMGKPVENAKFLISPGYVTALLGSPKLLDNLCVQFFNKFDRNNNGTLEFEELVTLTRHLHQSLSVPDEDVEGLVRKALEETGSTAMSKEQFPDFFAGILRESLSPKQAADGLEQTAKVEPAAAA